MTGNSKQKNKYLDKEKTFYSEIKSIFNFFFDATTSISNYTGLTPLKH